MTNNFSNETFFLFLIYIRSSKKRKAKERKEDLLFSTIQIIDLFVQSFDLSEMNDSKKNTSMLIQQTNEIFLCLSRDAKGA